MGINSKNTKRIWRRTSSEGTGAEGGTTKDRLAGATGVESANANREGKMEFSWTEKENAPDSDWFGALSSADIEFFPQCVL